MYISTPVIYSLLGVEGYTESTVRLTLAWFSFRYMPSRIPARVIINGNEKMDKFVIICNILVLSSPPRALPTYLKWGLWLAWHLPARLIKFFIFSAFRNMLPCLIATVVDLPVNILNIFWNYVERMYEGQIVWTDSEVNLYEFSNRKSSHTKINWQGKLNFEMYLTVT